MALTNSPIGAERFHIGACFDANYLYLFGQVPVLIGTSTCTYLNNYLYLLGQVPVHIWTTTCTYHNDVALGKMTHIIIYNVIKEKKTKDCVQLKVFFSTFARKL